jgi:phytoene dehydrogenase-like protein
MRPRGTSVRVVVVGAGHAGLVCAARLASQGIEVRVVEHAQRPGGALGSHAQTLPGFVHDHCAGFLPLTAASPAFRDLPLERHGLQWVSPEVAMAHPFRDGSAIALHRDLAATAASLDAAADGAGPAWHSLVSPLLARREQLLDTALSPLPPGIAALRLALALRRDGVELARRTLASAATFGLEVLGDARAAAWFSGSAVHSDLTPGSSGGAGFALFLKLLGHIVGWPYPRGGAGRLTDALVAHVRSLGGQVRCGAAVRSIEVRGGRARGVRLADGEGIDADAVVTTVSAGALAALLPGEALPARVMQRLRGWRYGVGTFKVDFALDGPVPWISPDARRAGVVHVGDTLEALFRSQQEAGLGRVPSEPAMVVGQHSLHDTSRAPAGKHTLYVYTHVPALPELPDGAIADRMEQRIEQFAPGFRNLVLARDVRSPQRLERENPSLIGGDLAAGSMELDQQGPFRPAPELARYRSPLRGLYVAGASTHPGPGVHGVSGRGAADALLADLSPLRFWR